MTHLLLLLALHATPAEHPNDVLLVSYQGAGRSSELTQSLLTAMSSEVTSLGFIPRASSESERQQRAATMCGEDGECLATLGRRLDTAWVLGLGVGTAGKQTLISVLLVNVESGRVEQRFNRQVATTALKADEVGREAVRMLFAGLAPRLKVTPPPVEATAPLTVLPEAPKPVAPMVVERPRTVRTAAIGTTIAAGILGVTGAGLSIGAGFHYASLAQTPPNQRPEADGLQRGLNVGADVTVGVAIAAAVVAVVLFVVDAKESP